MFCEIWVHAIEDWHFWVASSIWIRKFFEFLLEARCFSRDVLVQISLFVFSVVCDDVIGQGGFILHGWFGGLGTLESRFQNVGLESGIGRVCSFTGLNNGRYLYCGA